MHIVWHIAAMGNWQEVVREQLALLHQVQLLNVDCTFVGTGLDWLLPECQRHGVRVGIVRSDPNLMHYETFAMLHIERLVQLSAEPMLYFHTKGVSEITDPGKMPWRRLMENALIRNWRACLAALSDHDAVGVNWIETNRLNGYRPHFSGNFWLARASWLRQLPSFVAHHVSRDFVRFSCETWIGSKRGCRFKSLIYRDEPFWERPWRWGDGSSWRNLSLQQILHNYPRTDKGRNGPDGHCYVQAFYEKALALYRDKPIRLLEIGVQSGDSLLTWNDYFGHAEQITGIDCDLSALDFTYRPPRVSVLIGDAYRDGSLFHHWRSCFDIVIDDGDHALPSQIACVRHYLPAVKPGGLFVIEDVQNAAHAEALHEAVPEKLRPFAQLLDFRERNGRQDDMLFVVRVPPEEDR